MEKIQKLLSQLNENWIVEVYHSHFVVYDQENGVQIGTDCYSIPQVEEVLEKARDNWDMFSVNGYFKDDKTEFESYIITSWDCLPVGWEEEEIFHFGLSYKNLLHNLTTGGDDGLDFVVTNIKFETNGRV
jgi:hypothetical protein